MVKSVSDGSSSDEPSSSQASGVSSRSGTGTGGTTGAETTTSDSSLSLARSETRRLNRTKILVYSVILLAAGILGSMIYLIMSREETATFEIEVRSFSFTRNFSEKLSAISPSS
jgi:hypothetical protein